MLCCRRIKCLSCQSKLYIICNKCVIHNTYVLWTRCPSSARGSCDICSFNLCCKWRHSSSTWLASPTRYTPHQLATPSPYGAQPSWRFEPCFWSDLMAASSIRYSAFFDGSTMLARHIRSTGLLCWRPVALELSTRQLGSDNFRRLLNAHLFTLYWSIYRIRDFQDTIRSTNWLTCLLIRGERSQRLPFRAMRCLVNSGDDDKVCKTLRCARVFACHFAVEIGSRHRLAAFSTATRPAASQNAARQRSPKRSGRAARPTSTCCETAGRNAANTSHQNHHQDHLISARAAVFFQRRYSSSYFSGTLSLNLLGFFGPIFLSTSCR